MRKHTYTHKYVCTFDYIAIKAPDKQNMCDEGHLIQTQERIDEHLTVSLQDKHTQTSKESRHTKTHTDTPHQQSCKDT